MALGRAALDTVYKAMGKVKYIGENVARMANQRVSQFVENQRTASRNFRNRTDNSNYHKSNSYWAKNKN